MLRRTNIIILINQGEVMNRLTDLMIDIETMGTDPDAPVTSIGCAAYNLYDPTAEIKTFYVDLNWDEQVDSGKRKVSAGTIKFWLSQKPEAQKPLLKKVDEQVAESLLKFSKFVEDTFGKEVFYVWGNGPHFDMTILESLHKDYKMRVPWKYNKVNDLRTLMRIGKVDKDDVVREGVYHNALDDSLHQIKLAHLAMSKIGNKGVVNE
jgi:exodeoxyribonuclease VIII